jgi:hypothetical protein
LTWLDNDNDYVLKYFIIGFIYLIGLIYPFLYLDNDKIKYPTYNLSLLHDSNNKYVSDKLDYIVSQLDDDVFTKIYILDDILNLTFLSDYFVEECIKEKLGQYYLLLVSNNTKDTVKRIISHKYIDIIFDILIMDISVDDVCYKLKPYKGAL